MTETIGRRAALLLIGLGVPITAVALAQHGTTRAPQPDALTSAVLGELSTFTDWLDSHGARGFIGEVGWPDNSDGDGTAWNDLADAWYAAADRANLWVTAWATGEWWTRNYRLAVYQASRPPAGVDTPNIQARIVERHPGADGVLRGINVAGGSFAAASIEPSSSFSNEHAGVYDVDYHYDSQATFKYLASRGLRLVRVDCRWERLQPRLGQPLDAAELARLEGVVARAGAAGLRVVLDVHNYGAYYLSDGQQGVRQPIGSDALGAEQLADLWERLSAKFAQDERVVAYGLMNEPANLPSHFVARALVEGWETGQRWQADAGGTEILSVIGSPTHHGRGALRVQKTFPDRPGYGHLRVHDDGSAFARQSDRGLLGDTIGAWVYLPADAPGSHWEARCFVYAGGGHEADTSVGLQRGDWTLVTGRFTQSLLARARAIGLQVFANDVAGTAWIAVDDVGLGAELRPAELWEAASQMTVSAIRDAGDRKLVMVPGYNWSRIQEWTRQHRTPWIRDPAAATLYEAHHYWDRDQSSLYRQRYADERAIAARSTE